MIKKHKIVQVKQWLKEKTCKDGKLNFTKTCTFLAAIQVCLWLIKIICMLCGFIISTFVEIAPFLEAFFKILENLASTLSYNLRRSFFVDFYNTKLYGVSNKKYLSELLHLEKSTLKKIDKFYEVKPFLKKVNKKERLLYNPSMQHKIALKRIVKMLSFIGFPDYLCGGIPEVSYVTNASRHLEKNNLLLLDITNFFPSTKDSYVYDFFLNTLNQSTDIAKIMVNLTTAKSEDGDYRFLPQGYSTSPMLSFFAYHKMYERLNTFAERNDLTFSAYYDDFTFSSKDFIPKYHMKEAIKIIEDYGLSVNEKKTKLVKVNHTKITGVVVHEDKMSIPKGLFKKTYEHYLTLLDMDENTGNYTQDNFIDTCNKMQGCLAAIQSVEPERNLEHYKNMIRYIRNKYDVPVERKKKDKYFRKKKVRQT
ncbi:reverse transcriptase family protein [Enterococcus gilvus]|uniref:reverse transcriptase family protein n=1 Tax=Enterococcus gilvus TaxID=160453 RepID=UPI003D6B778E